MPATRRTLLVVEDESEINEYLTEDCESAIQQLNAAGFRVEGEVLSAESYEAAVQEIDSHPHIHFISVDLALQMGERGRDPGKRKQIGEVGGMRLLKHLRATQKQSLAVVVSGEGSIDYAIETHEAYSIMRFLVKGRPDFDHLYIGTVKAALRYFDTADLIANIEERGPTPTAIEQAARRWHDTLAEAQAVGLEVKAFPEDLGKRIETLRKQLRDPVTQLPTDEWAKHELSQRVLGEEHSWALIEVWVKNLGQFRESSAGDETSLLKSIVGLLRDASKQFTDDRAFLGTLGKAAVEPRFVAVLDVQDMGQAGQIKTWLRQEFETIAKSFTDRFAQKRGEAPVLPKLGIGTIAWDARNPPDEHQPIPDDQPPFSDYLQLLKALKRLEG